MKTHNTPWPDNFRLERDSKWETREYKSTFNILTNKYSRYESHKYYSLTGVQTCTLSIHKDKEEEIRYCSIFMKTELRRQQKVIFVESGHFLKRRLTQYSTAFVTAEPKHIKINFASGKAPLFHKTQ